jgi:hypothetical protein
LEILFTGASGIPDTLKQTFQNARDYVHDVMTGQMSEPELRPATAAINSIGEVIKSNYRTLG